MCASSSCSSQASITISRATSNPRSTSGPASCFWTGITIARAYIERARSAQGERQREAEALVHQGLDAFDRGEVEHARALLSDALNQGASHDLTLGVLDRIERLDVATGRTSEPSRPGRPDRQVSQHPSGNRRSARRGLAGTVLGHDLRGGRCARRRQLVDLDHQQLADDLASTGRRGAHGGHSRSQRTVASAVRVRGLHAARAAALRRRQAARGVGRVRSRAGRRPAAASADEMRAHIQRELLALALADTMPSVAAPSNPAGPRPE